MKSSFVGLACGILVTGALLSSASSASAQCAFNGPRKATKMSLSMVRAFAQCPDSGIPGQLATCQPIVPSSLYSFGPKGQCQLQLRVDRLASCATLSDQFIDEPCQTLSMKGKCTDILGPDGSPIHYEGLHRPLWSVQVTVRTTSDGFEGGDQTVMDFPTGLSGDAQAGKFAVDGLLWPIESALTIIMPPVHGTSPCTSVEILDAQVVDPDGAVFARSGMSTR